MKNTKELEQLIKTSHVLYIRETNGEEKNQLMECEKAFQWMLDNKSELSSLSPSKLEEFENLFRNMAVKYDNQTTQPRQIVDMASSCSSIITKAIEHQNFKGVTRV